VGHVPAGPANQWALEAVAVGELGLPRPARWGHEISAATRPVGAPATSGDRAVWPADPGSPGSHDDVAGAWLSGWDISREGG